MLRYGNIITGMRYYSRLGGYLARWAQQQPSLGQAGLHKEKGGDLLKKHHLKIVKCFSPERKFLGALLIG